MVRIFSNVVNILERENKGSINKHVNDVHF